MEQRVKESGIVNADPTQMHQVIMNLCTNAGHAMQEDGGVLTVELAVGKCAEKSIRTVNPVEDPAGRGTCERLLRALG